MKLYKFLNEDGTTPEGYGKWDLTGKWMPAIDGELKPCHNGYHVLRLEDLVCWLGPVLWEVEADNTGMVVDDNKVVVRRARLVKRVDAWNEKNATLFACDCAEHVLPNYETVYPGDKRIRHVIEAARYYMGGHISKELLATYVKAAESAESAAWSAESARWARWAAWSAESAARSVESEERKWQTARLLEYLKVLEG